MKFSRFFSIIFIFLLLNQSAFSLGKKDKDSDKKESEPVKEEKIPNETIKIDLFLDTKKPNSKNHFNWKASSKSENSSSSSSSSNSSNSYKDSFDTVSGASIVHSTKKFRDFSADSSSKNLRTPKGLRNLCLYAVSNPEMLSADNFSVTQQGKKLTITFTHRENSYKIETNEKGEIMVPAGFFIKLKEKNSEPKKENQTTTEQDSKDTKKSEKTEENQAPEKTKAETAEPTEIADNFQKDEPEESLKTIFKGKLTANLTAEGILTLKGKLKLTKKEKPEEPKKEAEEEKAEEEKSEEEKPEDVKSAETEATTKEEKSNKVIIKKED